MPTVEMTVNGRRVSAEVEARTLLVQFLREKLSLTGTHVGCDTSQGGACVVHLDGVAIKSCTVLALQANGGSVSGERRADFFDTVFSSTIQGGRIWCAGLATTGW